MRQIGEIKDPDHANVFVAYLLTKGISTKLEPDGDVWEIWVKDEDQLGLAAEELEQFQESPASEKYKGALQRANELLREEERKRRSAQQNIVKISETRTIQRRKGPLTILLIFLSAVVGLMTNFGAGENRTDEAFRTLSFVGLEQTMASEAIANADGDYDALDVRLASIYRGEVWRLVTPIFIHFDMLHIVFNMIWLFQLGRLIENRYGTFWFAMLVLATAIISNFAQGAAPAGLDGSPPVMTGVFLISHFGGMSGVVFGLFGFVWMKSTFDRASGFRIPPSTVLILLIWLFFCMTPYAEQVLGSGVANWAHGIGLLVGMVGGLLPNMASNAKTSS